MSSTAIPTPEQIRALPATSTEDLRTALEAVGLRVLPGRRGHYRVETADGQFVGPLTRTPSDWRSLHNSRSWLARRIGQIRKGRST